MLFNSYAFILLFLPIAIAGFYLAYRFGGSTASRLWTLSVSLIFYAWWNPSYIFLLTASAVTNYGFARVIQKNTSNKLPLLAGIAVNIGFLGYFKYADFFISNTNALIGTDFPLLNIVLPLGISFFLLQQIAFLVDVYEGLSEEKSFSDYFLFVAFFPQLIAGPIVHHRDMLPQFRQENVGIFNDRLFAYGLFVFSVGLFKKTVIADSLSDVVAAGYATSGNISATDAWITTTAYTLQAYFDFSGYSDMAVGIGLLFNIRLPLNFNSPYKATSIIQFWQHWHMTLTDFINAYLYMPLMRLRGSFSFYYSLFVTVIVMTIVGLWHGASWNFVLFGFMHGMALAVNHLWRRFGFSLNKAVGWLLTILLWHATLVVFRAETFDVAGNMYSAMLFGPIEWSSGSIQDAFFLPSFVSEDVFTIATFIIFGGLLYSCLKLKNPHEHELLFMPKAYYFCVTLFCLISSLLLMNHVTEFIYFKF